MEILRDIFTVPCEESDEALLVLKLLAATPLTSPDNTELLSTGDSLPSTVLRIPDYLVPEPPVKEKRNSHQKKCPASPTTTLPPRPKPWPAPSPEELEERRLALQAEMDLILEVKLWLLPEMAERLKEFSQREGELQHGEEHQERRGDAPEAAGDIQCWENRQVFPHLTFSVDEQFSLRPGEETWDVQTPECSAPAAYSAPSPDLTKSFLCAPTSLRVVESGRSGGEEPEAQEGSAHGPAVRPSPAATPEELVTRRMAQGVIETATTITPAAEAAMAEVFPGPDLQLSGPGISSSESCFLEKKMEAFQGCLAEYKDQILLTIHLFLAAGFVTMVIAACVMNFHRAVGLLVISLVTAFFLAWDWMMAQYGGLLWETLSPIRDLISRNWFWIKWMIRVLVLVAVMCWLALDTAKRGTRQLELFFGLLLLILLILLFSKHPFRWSWQTLLCGIGLQFIFGLLILRTTFGLDALKWVGSQAEKFMSFTDFGSKFVFGDSYTDHFFVFRVMPILFFFSSVISMLYHIGFMPWLICKIGFIMQVTMGTSPTESMAAAGNIFLGHTDSPLLIRPYISKLTISEIHAMMTGGFASISCTILGAFISFGGDATHLLTATLMSAPASLAIAKMFWPEKEVSVITSRHLKMDKGESKNLLEAASIGACRAVGLVANIVANLISFLALLAFFDAVLSWLGGMFDFPQLSFTLICSYVFMPLSFMMGVSWEDSFIAAELIGIKTFLNEFVAYQKLSDLIKRRKAGGPEYLKGVKQYISVHSESIATYALCEFSNFASLGMSIGVLSALAPDRRSDISRCGLRALIAGSVSCFMTACIAGMLYIPDSECEHFFTYFSNNTCVTNDSELLACCTQLLYHSVTVNGTWNITAGEGFSQSSLQACCTFGQPEHFNCSLLL
ncbi:LOW QUALITY PROTEIN: solute carrier family 28 member 3-like [Pholidichthys leucotaenia]